MKNHKKHKIYTIIYIWVIQVIQYQHTITHITSCYSVTSTSDFYYITYLLSSQLAVCLIIVPIINESLHKLHKSNTTLYYCFATVALNYSIILTSPINAPLILNLYRSEHNFIFIPINDIPGVHLISCPAKKSHYIISVMQTVQ